MHASTTTLSKETPLHSLTERSHTKHHCRFARLVAPPSCAGRLRPWFAALAAGAFAVHPIHTEAVASTVGMAELLMAAFGLAAAHLIINRRQQAGPAGRVGLGSLLGFLVLGWAACFSKETGSTLVRLLMKRKCGRLVSNIKHN